MSDATYDDLCYYDVVKKKNGKPFALFGTDYKVYEARASEIKDGNTFVYFATNESGTYSYGEIGYDEVVILD